MEGKESVAPHDKAAAADKKAESAALKPGAAEDAELGVPDDRDSSTSSEPEAPLDLSDMEHRASATDDDDDDDDDVDDDEGFPVPGGLPPIPPPLLPPRGRGRGHGRSTPRRRKAPSALPEPSTVIEIGGKRYMRKAPLKKLIVDPAMLAALEGEGGASLPPVAAPVAGSGSTSASTSASASSSSALPSASATGSASGSGSASSSTVKSKKSP